MAEFAGAFDLAPGDLSPSTAVEVEIPVPPAAHRWSLYITPKDSGSAPDPATVLQYGIGGSFYPTNPPSSMAAVMNTANIVTREDVVNRLKLIITPGASVPDGGIEIRLYMARSN